MNIPDWIEDVNYFVCVDPGFNGLGYAIFPNQPVIKKPVTSGVLRCKKSELPKMSMELKTKLQDVMYEFLPKQMSKKSVGLIIEYPTIWGGSLLSQTAATKGDISMLCYLIGVLSTLFLGSRVLLITPQEWKGQLPKRIVINRIKKIWPRLTQIRDHEADAIGIMASIFGKL